jgi:hypothetical protein
MQMIPQHLINSVLNPGMFDQKVKEYFQAANYEISNDKTLAGTSYFHWLNIGGLAQADFFTGTFNNAQTNVPGSNFVRPQSEHQLIYGMRVFTTGDVTVNLNWLPGADDDWTQNAIFTITSNSVVMVKDYDMNDSLPNLTTRENGAIPFQIPFIWGGQEELKINVRNKSGANAPANFGLKLELLAVGLV